MAGSFEMDGYHVKPVYSEREVNFEVHDQSGYVCRLVPKLFGFDLSPLDLALGNTWARPAIPRISELILNADA